jgi:hypothetical protein
MIDAVLLLWNRALLDYTKTAATWLRTRNRREPITDIAEQTMNTSTMEHRSHTVTQRIGYLITGLVLTLILGPLFIIGAYTVLTSLMSL